jgi:hypothetical protein
LSSATGDGGIADQRKGDIQVRDNQEPGARRSALNNLSRRLAALAFGVGAVVLIDSGPQQIEQQAVVAGGFVLLGLAVLLWGSSL